VGWGRGDARGGGGGIGVPNTYGLLTDLNDDVSLNASDLLNDYINDDEVLQQFFNTQLKSNFFDLNNFQTNFCNNSEPIFLSLNIQSLNSKYCEQKIFLRDLNDKNVHVDVIILQEI